MGYLFTVLTIINVAALAGAAWLIYRACEDMVTIVGTAVQDEVRKQDERIEKRLQRAKGPSEDIEPTLDIEPASGRLVAGRPMRR